ncbi:MAG: hypothetical protein GXW85_07935 [Clostridia bacterium]|nr:hypothetical protein [Clostridia bacterium]
MADNFSGKYGPYGGVCYSNFFFFETILMLIIIYWLLRWLFGWGYGAY